MSLISRVISLLISILMAVCAAMTIAVAPYKDLSRFSIGFLSYTEQPEYYEELLVSYEDGSGVEGPGLQIKQLDRLAVAVHVVVPGENIWTIARRYGINVSTIRSVNNLQSTLIRRGQRLIILNKKGLLHEVSEGETLKKIAAKYGRSVEEILEINNRFDKFFVKPGEKLFIPYAQIDFKDFLYPLTGRISSRFGWRIHPVFKKRMFHYGLDIASYYGAPVRASREGKVVFAGTKTGYGRTIDIRHDDGSVTRYGHLSKIQVRRGNWVDKRQIIGNVGTSGWTTGPHLHFEIIRGGRAINPLNILNK